MKNYSQKKIAIINDKTTEQNTLVLTLRQQHIAQRYKFTMKTRSSTSRSSRRSSDISGSQRIKRQRPRLQQQQNEKNYSSQDDRRQVVKGMEEEESSSSPKEDNIKRNKRLKNKRRIDECNKQNQNQNDEQKEELKEEEEVPWYRILFTRGDEEYDRYMRTEWGFEKVSKSR